MCRGLSDSAYFSASRIFSTSALQKPIYPPAFRSSGSGKRAFHDPLAQTPRQLLLNGGDAARVFALEHATDALRQLERALFHKFPVADDVDGDAWIDVADQVPVNVHFAVDLDDVLAARACRS